MESAVKEKTRAQAEREVRDLGWWHQDFELPNGVRTGTGKDPSYRPEGRWALIKTHVPEDLSGRSVLDVGGNAGYFSIQMKLRGAGRCVLVEPYREFAAQAANAVGEFGAELEVVNDDVHTYCLTTEECFDYVLFLGLFYHLKYPVIVLDRLAEMIKDDVHTYCLTTEECFDYVLFLGLFYHLKYPVIVLDRLAEMTKERIVFHSYSVEAESGPDADLERCLDRVDDAAIDKSDFPAMKFIDRRYNDDPTNWWFPTHTALEPMIRSAGLKVVARPTRS